MTLRSLLFRHGIVIIKRIDYIINEVAQLNDPRVKLIMCGHPEPDTADLKELGKKLLGDRVQWLTLPAEGVHSALYASDVYVIAIVLMRFLVPQLLKLHWLKSRLPAILMPVRNIFLKVMWVTLT